MDPILPQLEAETARRRRRRMFDHARVPVRIMVPNFVTLIGLCAGLTSIRMSIEGRWEFALAAIVFAAMLDGIDGRVARLLKASSRFGAELDSLADFVNFGVAPAVLLFSWGFSDLKSLGWIAVLIFALASALRLARFNVALDDDKPKWQSNFFRGMPTPAAAIVVLLPVYLAQIGFDAREFPWLLTVMLLYTVGIGLLMVSNIPTYSGKLLGERIEREWVLPLFVLGMALFAYLLTYPYQVLLIGSLAYLAFVPVSWSRFLDQEARDVADAKAVSPDAAESVAEEGASVSEGGAGQIVEMRAGDKRP